MNQTLLFLLNDLETSLNIYKNIESLEIKVIKYFNNCIEEWVNKNSSKKWTGKYDLNNDDAFVYKRSWYDEEEEASLIRLWFTAEEDDETLWLSNLFGLTENTFAAYYDFDKLISYVEDKKAALSFTTNFTKILSSSGYRCSLNSKKKYRFMKDVTLDSNLLHEALSEDCIEEGLKPITNVLDELLGFEKYIDSIIKKARNF